MIVPCSNIMLFRLCLLGFKYLHVKLWQINRSSRLQHIDCPFLVSDCSVRARQFPLWSHVSLPSVHDSRMIELLMPK